MLVFGPRATCAHSDFVCVCGFWLKCDLVILVAFECLKIIISGNLELAYGINTVSIRAL